MGKVQEHKRAAKARRQNDAGPARNERDDRFEVDGVVEECLPNTMFRVRIMESSVEQMKERVVLGTLAGKMRLFRIRVLPGDQVKGYVSKYDLEKMKITYRSAKRASQSV